MAKMWVGDDLVQMKLANVKESHSRLEGAGVVICFADAKAFKDGRMNWGKVAKTNPLTKALTANVGEFEFVITIPFETWQFLNNEQKNALLDLHLSRCTPVYLPKTEVVNGKKIPVQDEYGKIEYTDEYKLDKDGCIIWKVLQLDLPIFVDNVKKHGAWCHEMECIHVKPCDKPKLVVPGHDIVVTCNK